MKIYKSVDEAVLKEIHKVLDNDGLIIFPTDTVYGIACNAFSDKAINKLFQAKKRDFNKPIGVLTDSLPKINLVVSNINEKEKELIKKYFPGNLTIIFDKKEDVSDLLTSNQKTIGVRIPNHEIALKILKSYPYPLATSSANLSNAKEVTEIKDIYDIFKDSVDIFIDGGVCKDIPSTIIRVEEDKIHILREGSLKIIDK